MEGAKGVKETKGVRNRVQRNRDKRFLTPLLLSDTFVALAWVRLQARNFLMVADDMGLSPESMMGDHAGPKHSAQFDAVFRTSGVEVKRNTPMSPNPRARVERFIQTLKLECLKKFVIVAERHLDHVCGAGSRHYNE